MRETVSAAHKPQDVAAFRQGLEARGYVEGQNLKIEYRSADGPELFPMLARELVNQNVAATSAVTRELPHIFRR
jgi:hypothetical protein